MAAQTVGRVGAYPGTFDPPTVAHLAVAEAAWRQADLDRVHLVVSRAPLGKAPTVPSFADRIAVLEEIAATRDWLEVRVTDRRLIAEVVAGYDAVVMGLDKWLQVIDPVWYGGSEAERDRAVAGLPPVLLADRHHPDHHHPDHHHPDRHPDRHPRQPFAAAAAGRHRPPGGLRVLDVAEHHRSVSSTSVRAGRHEWMAEEAARFDIATGAWSDPDRYLRVRRPDALDAPGGATIVSPMPGRTSPLE